MNYDDPHQVEEVLDKRMEAKMHHAMHSSHALQSPGRRASRSGNCRGRAGRDQDHGLDRPAAGNPGSNDRRRAGRYLPWGVSLPMALWGPLPPG